MGPVVIETNLGLSHSMEERAFEKGECTRFAGKKEKKKKS